MACLRLREKTAEGLKPLDTQLAEDELLQTSDRGYRHKQRTARDAGSPKLGRVGSL